MPVVRSPFISAVCNGEAPRYLRREGEGGEDWDVSGTCLDAGWLQGNGLWQERWMKVECAVFEGAQDLGGQEVAEGDDDGEVKRCARRLHGHL